MSRVARSDDARRPSGGLSRRACLALLPGSVGWQAAARSSPPEPSEPRPPTLATPLEALLANGMRVVVANRPGVPLVSVRLVVLAGSETDPPRRSGRAALTAALLSRGTRNYTAPALAGAAESLGASLVSESGRHHSNVAMTVTTPMLGAALGLIAEVVMRPTFRTSELVRLRSQMQDELKLAYASPSTLASMATERLLFGDSAYGRAVDGTPTSLPRIARGELFAMHATYFRPQHAALLLTGDIDLATAVQSASRHFGDWQPGSPSPVAGAAPGMRDTPISNTPLVALDLGGGGQASIVLGIRLPGRAVSSEQEAATAAVANAVLGADYSSRLNQEIRIRRGLSYGAGSSVNLLPRAGMLLASVQTRNATAADVVELMQREVDRLIESPVPADELGARKASLIGRFARSVETTDGLAAQLVTRLANGVAPASLSRTASLLAAVDADDIQRYVREHFGRNARRIVVGGDAGQFAAQLEAIEPRTSRLTPKDLDFD